MALTTCDECGAEVSTGAKACPGCGGGPKTFQRKARKARRNRIWLFVAGFFIFAAGLQAMMDRSAVPETPSDIKERREAGARHQSTLAAAEALKASMRNPDSIVFEEIYADTQGEVVCIDYRAENGFGGMDRGKIVYLDLAPDESAQSWNKHCTEQELFDVTLVSRLVR